MLFFFKLLIGTSSLFLELEVNLICDSLLTNCNKLPDLEVNERVANSTHNTEQNNISN